MEQRLTFEAVKQINRQLVQLQDREGSFQDAVKTSFDVISRFVVPRERDRILKKVKPSSESDTFKDGINAVVRALFRQMSYNYALNSVELIRKEKVSEKV